jgi:hypothetical protein
MCAVKKYLGNLERIKKVLFIGLIVADAFLELDHIKRIATIDMLPHIKITPNK